MPHRWGDEFACGPQHTARAVRDVRDVRDVRTVLREVSRDVLALVWPTVCVACGAPDRECCDACRAELDRLAGSVTRVHTAAGVAAYVAGPYEGPRRALLLAHKHGGRTGLARQLGAQCSAPLRAALHCARGPAPPLLVPIPSRPARVRQRGYHHVEQFARAALRTLAAPRPTLCRALRVLPGRRPQVGLSLDERLQNAARVAVRGRARRVVRGREVILIDDIVTTGATLHGAARALTAAGARVVAVVALCAMQKKSSRE